MQSMLAPETWNFARSTASGHVGFIGGVIDQQAHEHSTPSQLMLRELSPEEPVEWEREAVRTA